MAKTSEEARIHCDFAKYEDLHLYPITRGSIHLLSSLDGYNCILDFCTFDHLFRGSMNNMINSIPIFLLIDLKVQFLRITLNERMDDENSIKH